jgi:hypothetical protein
MKTKKLHFTLQGNNIFKKEPPNVIIEDISLCLEEYESEEDEYNKKQYRYEHMPTLRDICVLLYQCCGHGVLWQFSRVMSKELKIDKIDVLYALEKTIKEYAEMSEEDALKKYKKDGKYIETPKSIIALKKK